MMLPSTNLVMLLKMKMGSK